MLYDTALFGLADSLGIDFLQWRVWIGVWLSVIALAVAAFQVSMIMIINYKNRENIINMKHKIKPKK